MFAKTDKVKNIALACMGFALIFYGLNLMTGGLRPLRNMPEVMGAISALKADNFMGLVYCILIAAFITALIHSSSATIGIVMGLGSAGVLDWQTAVAFSLGADLGTTITSWMASLNLSEERQTRGLRAYLIQRDRRGGDAAAVLPLDAGAGLCDAVVRRRPRHPGHGQRQGNLPAGAGGDRALFDLLQHLQYGDPVPVRRRVRARAAAGRQGCVGRLRGFLDAATSQSELCQGSGASLAAIQRETARYLDAAVLFLDIARQHPNAPDDSVEHNEAIDMLSREIRTYTAGLFDPSMPHDRADLVASLIEEEDFSASLGESLYQIARRVERHPFSDPGRKLVNEMLDLLAQEMSIIVPGVAKGGAPALADNDARLRALADLRDRTIKMADLSWEDRGAILALLGSAERAFYLIDRIHEERLSVPRVVTVNATKTAPCRAASARPPPFRPSEDRHDLSIQQTQLPCRSGSAPVSKPYIPACAGGARQQQRRHRRRLHLCLSGDVARATATAAGSPAAVIPRLQAQVSTMRRLSPRSIMNPLVRWPASCGRKTRAL